MATGRRKSLNLHCLKKYLEQNTILGSTDDSPDLGLHLHKAMVRQRPETRRGALIWTAPAEKERIYHKLRGMFETRNYCP